MPDISNLAAPAAAEAATALSDVEAKAEHYALVHLFGMQRGEAYMAVLTGNATVQTALNGASVKAISWLEALTLKYLMGGEGKQLFGLLHKVGLA